MNLTTSCDISCRTCCWEVMSHDVIAKQETWKTCFWQPYEFHKSTASCMNINTSSPACPFRWQVVCPFRFNFSGHITSGHVLEQIDLQVLLAPGITAAAHRCRQVHHGRREAQVRHPQIEHRDVLLIGRMVLWPGLIRG